MFYNAYSVWINILARNFGRSWSAMLWNVHNIEKLCNKLFTSTKLALK